MCYSFSAIQPLKNFTVNNLSCTKQQIQSKHITGEHRGTFKEPNISLRSWRAKTVNTGLIVIRWTQTQPSAMLLQCRLDV